MNSEGLLHSYKFSEVFPTEIRELILEHVVYTEDIMCMLKAIPNLKDVAKGKQFSWLIGEVMPLLFQKFLNFSPDIKTCRLVSKRWMNSVNTCFSEHPDRLPYNSPKLNRIKEHHFCYHPLSNPNINIQKCLLYGYDTSEEIFGSHHNPFPSKYLSKMLDIPHHMNSQTRIEDVLEFLSRFGKHINQLEFQLWGHGNCTADVFLGEYVHGILECISKVPNLKSLILGSLELRRAIKRNDAITVNLNAKKMNLPNLEILDLSRLCDIAADVCSYIISSLIMQDNIQAFGIHTDHWDKRYGNMFPNLTELRLSIVDTNGDAESIRRVLSDLESPNLRKLRLGKFNGLGIYELLNILIPLRIETLELIGPYMSEDDEFEGDVVVLSIRDLKLRVYPYHTYEFLKSVPNLTHLSVYYIGEDWDGWEPSDDGSENSYFEDSFGISFRDFLLGYEADPSKLKIVWESLPSLMAINVCGGKQYYREYPGKSFTAVGSTTPEIFYN